MNDASSTRRPSGTTRVSGPSGPGTALVQRVGSGLDWDPPEAQWFVGGKLNASYNCLDYQVEQGRGTRPQSSGRGTSLKTAGPSPTPS